MVNLDSLARREFLRLAAFSALSLAGCRDKHHHNPIDTDNPGTPSTPPGPNPQQDFHNFSGSVRDTDGNLISGARVRLRVRNSSLVYEADSNSSGNYVILNIPNGDYVLTLADPNSPQNNFPDFFGYEDPVKLISAQGDISKDFYLIRSLPQLDSTHVSYGRNLLAMLKDVTENNDGRTSLPADSIQKARRFDLSSRVKLFLDPNLPLGYSSEVQTALSQWESETGLPLFALEQDPRFAKIEIYSNSPLHPSNGQKAYTEFVRTETINGVGVIKKATVSLDNSLSPTDARRYSLRELGHILLNAKRGSRDELHAIFKDPNNPDRLLSSGISDDESRVVRAYYGLPIGERLMPYKI